MVSYVILLQFVTDIIFHVSALCATERPGDYFVICGIASWVRICHNYVANWGDAARSGTYSSDCSVIPIFCKIS